MYKSSLFVILMFLFLGCSMTHKEHESQAKSDLSQVFSNDETYHRSLVNTQKAQLGTAMETKALLTATYLNPVFMSKKVDEQKFASKMNDGEYFFIGVYIIDSQEHVFNAEGYSLTLNGFEPLEVIQVDTNNPLYNKMPMVDTWSSYYKVKFKKSPKDNFSLIFENDRFGKDILNYAKGEKALFQSLGDSNK